jgi:serine/threonine protein phosphatase PrpC
MATPFEQEIWCWQVGGRSVRGASHIRSGAPNQDAIAWAKRSNGSEGVLLAVADGHGSAKCFRSDCGSRMAVEAALAVLDPTEPIAVENTPAELVRRWRNMVRNHLCENPIGTNELQELERKLGKAARRAVESDPVLAYGSTVLAAAVSETTGLYIQLGDGDILTVSSEGEVARLWPRDETLLGDETTSLATRNAANAVRVYTTNTTELLPELVLLSTDGYANSFRKDEGFLAVGPDLLEMIRSEGIDAISGQLEPWLREASEQGSGDDVTLGILWRGGLHAG